MPYKARRKNRRKPKTTKAYGSGTKTPKFVLLDDQDRTAREQPLYPLPPELMPLQLQPPLNQVVHFSHGMDEPVVAASHPSDAELRQHQIENKLLKRYLAVTKARFAQTRPAPDAASALENAHESIQEDRLREEIADLRQQLNTAVEEGNQNQQQTLHELEQTKSELAALKESSDADKKRAAEDLANLSRERFDLECALQELRERLNGDSAIEQMQINALQQSLSEANDKAERTAAVLNNEIEQLQTEQATLQQTLEESRAQLAQAQKEHCQRESDLQAAFDDAHRSADESLALAEARNGALQQQLQTLQSSLQELLQEKTELGGCLQAETKRALEFAEQAQSLDRRGQRLEEELIATRQAGLDAENQHRSVIASQDEALKQAQLTIDELNQSLLQTSDMLQQSKDEA
ncbi:MAG: hypothetical protein P8178_13050, partial [Candidatus Thiodiazotropha sp.]